MKSIWTPEPVHVHRARRLPKRATYALWAAISVLLVAWIAAMAAGVSWGGWEHLLLAVAAPLVLINVLCDFRYVDYLEPMDAARDRLLHEREERHARRHP